MTNLPINVTSTEPSGFVSVYAAARAAKRDRDLERALDRDRRREKERQRHRRAADAAAAIADPREREMALERLDHKVQFAVRKREEARFTKELARSRAVDGFHHRDRFRVVLGRHRDPFSEYGLRSETMGEAGLRFVAGTNRGGTLRGGNEKDLMEVHSNAKILALDMPYIEANRTMVSLIRIDLDAYFDDSDHLHACLEAVWKEGKLACMPHLIAGDVVDNDLDDTRGRRPYLVNPHLWIILPYAVCNTAKGRPSIIALLDGVNRGIVRALVHLGADENAPLLSVRGKNPLSPFLVSDVYNEDHFPTLSDWAKVVDTRTTRSELARMAAEHRSGAEGVSKTASNAAFTYWQAQAFALLRQAHADGHPDYLAATSGKRPDALALGDFLAERMSIATLQADTDLVPTKGAWILSMVIRYASTSWDPARADRKPSNRGAMRGTVEGMDLKARQAASGRRSSATVADRALGALGAAYDAIVAEGGRPTQTAVAQRAGLARATANRRWNEVCNSRCIVKKEPLLPGLVQSSNPPTQTEGTSAISRRVSGSDASVIPARMVSLARDVPDPTSIDIPYSGEGRAAPATPSAPSFADLPAGFASGGVITPLTPPSRPTALHTRPLERVGGPGKASERVEGSTVLAPRQESRLVAGILPMGKHGYRRPSFLSRDPAIRAQALAKMARPAPQAVTAAMFSHACPSAAH